MQPDAAFQISLYYRDALSNMVTVAATTVTNTAANFPTTTNFVDFSIRVPGVQPTDPWAGKNIGIRLLSLATTNNQGGYWDVDNVRLTETVENELADPAVSNGHFQLTLHSEPGLRFEVLASTNAALAVSNWSSLGTVTNVTGSTPFVDGGATLLRRYYRGRQLP